MKKDANSILKNIFDKAANAVNEGYKVLPPMDDKYQPRDGLEGPFTTLSGKVVYYDPGEGAYYDPDTDFYISYDEYQELDKDYSGMKTEGVETDYENEIDQIIDEIKELGITDVDEIASVVGNFIDNEDDAEEVYVTVLDFLGLAESISEGAMDDEIAAYYRQLKLPNMKSWKKLTKNENLGGSPFRASAANAEDYGMFSQDGNYEVQEIVDDACGMVKSGEADIMKAVDAAMRMLTDLSEMGGHEEAEDTAVRDSVTRAIWNRCDNDDTNEGHSPHKKGTKKYNAHMAAMHAEGKEMNEAQIDKMKVVSKGFMGRKEAERHNDKLVGSGKVSNKSYVHDYKGKFYVVDIKESVEEGKSPHKKGTKKYKAHMAAMHAEHKKKMVKDPKTGKMVPSYAIDGKGDNDLKEKVSISQVKESINTKSTDKNRIVADYIGGYLNGNLTESQVKDEIKHVVSQIRESVDANVIYTNMRKTNIQESLDKKLMVRESIAQLQKIVSDKQMMPVKFTDGSMKIDMTTANIVLDAYKRVKPENQQKIEKMMETTYGFKRLLDIIYK